MTIRKRRQPTPHFKLPPPYQPITGERASLMAKGDYPYCAMMQVAAEDTHADYVICRGFDPRIRKFFNYEEGNDDKPGIPVAKPYGSRGAAQYEIGQVFPAVIPLTRLGQNSGVAADTTGHPADLDEEVEILKTDDDSKVINWLLLEGVIGIPFICDQDVPSHGVMVFDRTKAEVDDVDKNAISLTQAYTLDPGPLYVNGASDVTAGDIGRCHQLSGTPLMALVDPDLCAIKRYPDYSSFWTDIGRIKTFEQYGPVPGTWTLGQGLPGAQLAIRTEANFLDVSQSHFIAAPVPGFWGIAKENWTRNPNTFYHTVLVNPAMYMAHNEPTFNSDWDGTDGYYGSGGEEEIEVRVLLHCHPDKHPNIVAGDQILCIAKPQTYLADPEVFNEEGTQIYWMAVSGYVDDKIGTVKMWSGIAGDIPQGWAIMDGTNNSVANGGSGVNLGNQFIRSGSAVGGPASFGTTGSDYSRYDLLFIERLDNSS